MGRPIRFEYQEFPGFTLVSLDSRLADYGLQPEYEGEELKVRMPAKTVKDCRAIDGCVYLHLGRAEDAEMVELIEKFQKLRAEGGWTQGAGLAVPDHKFDFGDGPVG